mmetsp:Transcript_21703/g.51473  ORF Transcript_21703/g.51473 Transcript_21703/m.51473 type:complete len:476 (-) Transcript_21703:71-1498(-)
MAGGSFVGKAGVNFSPVFVGSDRIGTLPIGLRPAHLTAALALHQAGGLGGFLTTVAAAAALGPWIQFREQPRFRLFGFLLVLVLVAGGPLLLVVGTRRVFTQRTGSAADLSAPGRVRRCRCSLIVPHTSHGRGSLAPRQSDPGLLLVVVERAALGGSNPRGGVAALDLQDEWLVVGPRATLEVILARQRLGPRGAQACGSWFWFCCCCCGKRDLHGVNVRIILVRRVGQLHLEGGSPFQSGGEFLLGDLDRVLVLFGSRPPRSLGFAGGPWFVRLRLGNNHHLGSVHLVEWFRYDKGILRQTPHWIAVGAQTGSLVEFIGFYEQLHPLLIVTGNFSLGLRLLIKDFLIERPVHGFGQESLGLLEGVDNGRRYGFRQELFGRLDRFGEVAGSGGSVGRCHAPIDGNLDRFGNAVGSGRGRHRNGGTRGLLLLLLLLDLRLCIGWRHRSFLHHNLDAIVVEGFLRNPIRSAFHEGWW